MSYCKRADIKQGFSSIVKGRKNQRKSIITFTGTRRLKISLKGILAVRTIPREMIRADKRTVKLFDTAKTMEKKSTSIILTLGSRRLISELMLVNSSTATVVIFFSAACKIHGNADKAKNITYSAYYFS